MKKKMKTVSGNIIRVIANEAIFMFRGRFSGRLATDRAIPSSADLTQLIYAYKARCRHDVTKSILIYLGSEMFPL